MFNCLRISLLAISLLGNAQIVRADIIDGEDLVDPTRPINLSANTSSGVSIPRPVISLFQANYEVSFVRAGSTSPMAIVNDQRVTLGDLVGDAEVVAIDRSSVTLRIAEQEQRISVFDTSVKSVARETEN